MTRRRRDPINIHGVQLLALAFVLAAGAPFAVALLRWVRGELH